MPQRASLPEPGKPISPREIWQLEAEQFCTWLAEPQGIRMLSAAIGCELVADCLEVQTSVGRVDVIFAAADFASGEPTAKRIIAECYLKSADDDHLHRLLDYAAVTNACAAALVAPAFSVRQLRSMAYANRSSRPGETGMFAVLLSCFYLHARKVADLACVVSPPGMPRLTHGPGAPWLEQAASVFEHTLGEDHAPCQFSSCGQKLQIPTSQPDVWLELGQDAEGALLAVSFDCPDPLHARNLFKHSLTLRDGFLPQVSEIWDPAWDNRLQRSLAPRIFGKLDAQQPQAAADAVLRLTPAIDRHVTALNRFRFVLGEDA